MDCEKFDLHVMDALYDELDELTYAALRRHVEGCSRCGAVWNELRATREVGVFPIVEPPADLEDRILEAAFAAQKTSPFPRKVLRALAWAGSHAMRPQLAMAALFFLVIGSSLLLLRSRPGSGALVVTERGAPAPEEPMPPSPMRRPRAAAAADRRPRRPRPPSRRPKTSDGEQKLAKQDKEKDKSGDAKAALVEARAARDRSGCAAAVGKFDEVGARFPATNAAADAMWEEASCYKSLGEAAKQRELLLALKANPQYKNRVDAELDVAEVANNSMQQRAVAAGAPAHAAAPPAAGRRGAAARGARGASPPRLKPAGRASGDMGPLAARPSRRAEEGGRQRERRRRVPSNANLTPEPEQ